MQNGASLLAGNGILLDVSGASTMGFTADSSLLRGDLVADDSSTLDVTLQNGARLFGNLVNTNSVAINSRANWTLTGDARSNRCPWTGGA
ncbi:hypothetical protein QNM99_16875 [Pseudomonas sp. PCH446]